MTDFYNLCEKIFIAPSKNEKDKNYQIWLKHEIDKRINPNALVKLPNGMYNYNEDLMLWNLNIKSFSELPYQFYTINGYFDCSHNELTSLQGCPQVITKGFYCSINFLTTLESGPKQVGGEYFCSSNKITSLKGCPNIINGNFDCSYNKLTSLRNGPANVKGNYLCYSNKTQFYRENVTKLCLVEGYIAT